MKTLTAERAHLEFYGLRGFFEEKVAGDATALKLPPYSITVLELGG